MFDFNKAAPQEPGKGSLIPAGTVALAVMTVRPGGGSDGGVLKPNKVRDKEMLDVEFTIVAGPYERRKVWTYFTIKAGPESEAPNISKSQLRAALESAYGVSPADDSDEAMAKRVTASWMDFDGLKVCIKIGVEKQEGWDPKNKLTAFITPDEASYISPGPQRGGAKSATVSAIAKAPTAAASASAQAKPINKPAWAN